ncbi:polyphenol oxidase [Marchantia polymorpha subsp. ruderalis]|uniref:Tyrosinase copper-binding domain-containing protein n=1 Tax=Marchantia polymorpha TaxID=3197 RepID=A0A2R6XDI4_MARPO|nr:hypothetical protein MARPO_0021s0041 [Marchantia polymorpha]BBN01239.1 hypothetical protein Mp_2g05850 [Marchantia polymorpha subsp. ruderalis]|eukprot:PTQ44165.1 hypothetical protein MARPO_0021s0041 [Marchantia polymorpha]
MAASGRFDISVHFIQLLVCCAWLVTNSQLAQSAPIKITFDGCIPGFANNKTQYCCPPPYKGEIVDFCPKRNMSKPLRVRKALQCLSGHELKVYTEKLDKAYTILRNLPDDDPRSLNQQKRLHCSYGTGGFVQQGTDNITIDIHFSWLFFPWHRYFIYFHERIIQHVLDDPEFSLHFWNWDNGFTVHKPKGARSGCYKRGDLLPPIYNITGMGQYQNRSSRTKLPGLPVDLGIVPEERDNPPTRPAEVVKPRNLATMHASMVTVGNTTRGFMGRIYRYGDYQVLDPLTGAGGLEVMGHASIHWWVGNTMGVVETSAGDPLFYAHHSNIDRLWNNWHKVPGGERVDYSDPDFLEAEFLFYDETATIRRVKVKDALDMEEFGYKFQKANDISWIDYVPTVNSTSNSTINSTDSYKPQVHFPTRWNRD